MTESHAKNVRQSISEHARSFEGAMAFNNWTEAHRALLRIIFIADSAIRESIGCRHEADALAAELLVYRPTRDGRPAAPALSGHVYVFTAKFPWVCAAVELRETVHVKAGLGCGYFQEHYVPERKTLCGKAVTFPVSERFTSGGWPRLHELCPDCTKLLVEAGLVRSEPHAEGSECRAR